MHNNYYLLKQLLAELAPKLEGATLVDAYSQNKNELILQFLYKGEYLNFVAHLTGQFTCLAFPKETSKAKRNTATLFPEIDQAKVTRLRQFANERAFSIYFEHNYVMVFKLFGRQANVILYKNDQPISLFRKGFKADLGTTIDKFDRPIPQDLGSLKKSWPDFSSVFPTLNKRNVQHITASIAHMTATEGQNFVLKYIKGLENPKLFSIVEQDNKVLLEFGKVEDAVSVYSSSIQAITEYFYFYQSRNRFLKTQNELLGSLGKNIGKTEVYLTKTLKKLNSLENDLNYHKIGDLLMANLNQIKAGLAEIILDDFYTDQPVKIKLNPKLNAQMNAERYYKKGKNLSIELDNLRSTIREKRSLLQTLKDQQIQVMAATSLKELKPLLKQNTSDTTIKKTPFKEFTIDGFTVYVGNNAKQNDLLTLKYAKKDDLFFHAKDVAGSHVILKQQSGKPFPNNVLEKVAGLAAYYSKRKTDSLCPVGYTPKKYVRKPKGSPPGLVHVEREKVLLIKPELPN